MRCPKCGAFLEEGKDICMMCGTNAKTYTPDNNNQFSNVSGFSNNSVQPNQFFNRPQTQTTNLNKYNKEISYNEIAKGDRDFFDFAKEHNKIIKIVLSIVFVLALIFGVYKYIEYKNAPEKKVPVIGELYYKVADTFTEVKANDGYLYSKTGSKGTDCAIEVTYNPTTENDHVKTFFELARQELKPEEDDEGNIIDQLQIFTANEGEQTINKYVWYFLNISYRPDLSTETYSVLKHRYISSTFNGYSYDIKLTNNAGDNACNIALDQFTSSLEFIEE